METGSTRSSRKRPHPDNENKPVDPIERESKRLKNNDGVSVPIRPKKIELSEVDEELLKRISELMIGQSKFSAGD